MLQFVLHYHQNNILIVSSGPVFRYSLAILKDELYLFSSVLSGELFLTKKGATSRDGPNI